MGVIDPASWARAIGGDPQVKVQAQQNAQAERYNQLLRDLQAQSRGATGHAVLSEALGGTERQAGDYASQLYGASRGYYGTPQDVVQRGAKIATAYTPLLEQGAKSIYGIYSGDEEAKRLAAAQPAFAARTALGATTRAGLMQGVMDRLNALRAENAGKGFLGSGSAAENLALRTQIGGTQAAAGSEAAAALQNAQEAQAIRNRVLDLQLQSPQLAGALAAQAAQLQLYPAQLAGGISTAQLSPLDYFRLPMAQVQRPEMAPWAQPTDRWGGVFSGIGQDAQTAGRYFLNRDLANRYNQPQYGSPAYNQNQAAFNEQYGSGTGPYGEADFNYQFGEGGDNYTPYDWGT